MIDLSDIQTKKGTKVVLVFEEESLRKFMQEKFSLPQLLDFLATVGGSRRHIHDWDTGNGKTVYILFDETKAVNVLTEAEYAEWNKNPVWFDSRPQPMFSRGIDPLDLILGAGFDEIPGENPFARRSDPGMNLVGALFAAAMMADMPDQTPNEFIGPTDEQVREFLKNPVSLLVLHQATTNENCLLCLATNAECSNRDASFDPVAFEKALAEY